AMTRRLFASPWRATLRVRLENTLLVGREIMRRCATVLAVLCGAILVLRQGLAFGCHGFGTPNPCGSRAVNTGSEYRTCGTGTGVDQGAGTPPSPAPSPLDANGADLAKMQGDWN